MLDYVMLKVNDEGKFVMRGSKRRLILLAVTLILILGGAFWHIAHLGQESTDDAAIEAHVISISPHVSGYVTTLAITDNQLVKKGDLLLDIAPEDYALKRDQAKAALDSAQAAETNAQVNIDRLRKMGASARSQKDLDDAVAAEATTAAEVESAKAALALAEQDVSYAHMLSPVDGVVAMRNVEPGAYVIPGQQLFALVSPERWVVANFKERQIEHMQPGQKVDISVDAYPALHLTGKIDSIQHGTGGRFSAFPPENAMGNYVKVVQRVPVKITIDSEIPQGIVLAPGMSVVPTVYTK